jgi:glycosyltransferase involved in cell wall biosynthesis
MSKSFTVAHVNVARGFRGGERQTELLIRELEKRQVRQVLVARRDGMLAERIASENVEIRTVSGNPFGVALACGGVDLIHVHEGRSVYGAYLRSLISGTPYVVTRRVNNPVRRHFFAYRAYRRAAFVAAVASQVGLSMQEFDANLRVRIVHSGSSGLEVNPQCVARLRERFEGRFIVGHVGALDNAQKGQEYIIQTARSLQASHPDICFVLVGGGEDEAALKGLARGLENLSFTGFVENVGDYLALFDVFILPSNREGVGSILLDAMERRLPIIASRVGGVPDIVHDGKNGLLIDPARPDQLEEAILTLRQAPEQRRRLGNAGFEIAKQFTAAAMAEKYLSLYEQCLASRPAHAR